MKNLTKEQIDEAVTKTVLKEGGNSCNLLLKNLDKYMEIAKESDEEVFKNYPHYFALMTTAFQMSVNTLKESLYELLCDE